MYGDNGHVNAGWGVLMMVSMLLFWVLIALVIVWFVRTTRAPHPPHLSGRPVTGSAEQILGERLARGEIEPDGCQRSSKSRPVALWQVLLNVATPMVARTLATRRTEPPEPGR